MNAWKPIFCTEREGRYTVVLVSLDGKTHETVNVIATSEEQAEEHALTKFPSMHVSDSWHN